MITRFTVPKLQDCSIRLSNVASQREVPELVLYNSRILSTYTERILDNKEIIREIYIPGKLVNFVIK